MNKRGILKHKPNLLIAPLCQFHIPEKDLRAQFVCSSGFMAAFETIPGDTKRKKKQTHGYFSDVLSFGFLLQCT